MGIQSNLLLWYFYFTRGDRVTLNINKMTATFSVSRHVIFLSLFVAPLTCSYWKIPTENLCPYAPFYKIEYDWDDSFVSNLL